MIMFVWFVLVHGKAPCASPWNSCVVCVRTHTCVVRQTASLQVRTSGGLEVAASRAKLFKLLVFPLASGWVCLLDAT